MNQYKRHLTITICLLLLGSSLGTNLAMARDKDHDRYRSQNLKRPDAVGETVINIGAVHSYMSNSTVEKATGEDDFSFLLGHSNFTEASMMWLEGGYADNHYLYVGIARIGIGGTEVRLNSLTSEDWTVIQNDPEQVSPYEVYYSMTDELAGANERGIWASQRIHAWSESYRDDFFVIEYDIANIGNTAYDDMYFWYHIDADVSAAAGGSGTLAYYRDDIPSFFIGTDINGNPEHISYMYDGDNPDIGGDDTGGKLTPKESLGFIGSRVLECPQRSGEGPETANTQSGHQWWDWNSDPPIGGGFYNLAIKHEFKADPGSPHDYRYMQIMGPFDLNPQDTIHIAVGFGIGEGLEGLRQNLQWAYDLYWNDFQGPAAPNAPQTRLEKGDGWIKILWDDSTSQDSQDPLTGEKDFQGYRLYRSLDRTNWTLLAGYDLVDDIGANSGLPVKNQDGMYEYLDEDVTNGFLYYYSVTAYDRGTETLPSLETGKTVNLFAQPGPLPTGEEIDKNLIRVVPNPFVVKAPWDLTPTIDNPSEERIQFQNIPRGSKITVFNLAGDMIIELQQQGEDGYVDWNLITRNRQKVVSGLYLYVVEPPKGENFIDKFVIVR